MSALCRYLRRPTFDLSLYLVANRPSFQNESLFFSKISESVKGGVSCVQLRDHQNDFTTVLKTAIRLKKMLKNTPLFINTRHSFEIAQAVEAEGIYLEEKISPSEARRRLGQTGILGISVKTLDEVLVAGQTKEIDYLSVKIFPSKRTCPKNDVLWGLEGLRQVRALSQHRIVAIGGLNLECAESVYRELSYRDGIAMAGGLMEENDPQITAQKIQAIRQRTHS